MWAIPSSYSIMIDPHSLRRLPSVRAGGGGVGVGCVCMGCVCVGCGWHASAWGVACVAWRGVRGPECGMRVAWHGVRGPECVRA